MEEEKSVYDKPANTIEDLLKKMISKGLPINEENEILAKTYLRTIGYYRLSKYFGPFQDDEDKFKEGTTFDDITRLYDFDSRLRYLLGEALGRLEIEIKATMTRIMSFVYDAYWYSNEDLFDMTQTEKKYHQGQEIYEPKYPLLLAFINEQIGKLSEMDEIKRFYEEYHEDSPVPCWIVMEAISFGKISRLYSLIKSSEKNDIALHFGAINSDYFSSWLHGLVILRNACAHHGRVWNKKFRDIKMPTRKKHKFVLSSDPENFRKLYGILSCILCMFKKIDSDGYQYYKNAFIELSDKYLIDYTAMGFPENWREDPIWKETTLNKEPT